MQLTRQQPTTDFPPQPKRTSRLTFLLRSREFGYVAGILFVGALLLLEKLDHYLPQAPLFAGAPFALISILTALLWGTGPALLCFGLGLGVMAALVAPGIITNDYLRDIAILSPFVLLQLVAMATVLRLERTHRGLLAAQSELEAANQQLREATQFKDYLIMRASHELRTPLTTILGRTQLLAARLEKSGDTPANWEAVHTYLDVVGARAQHLRSLLESLFELSRVHTAAPARPLPSCDLGSLCRAVVENQRELSGRHIELDLPEHALMVPGDDTRLTQVLEHLVNNAIKYSPPASTIRVQGFREGNFALLCVHNASPALSPEQLVHLFDPFYRTREMEYSPIPGWGLGLTVSKEIVEQHRGHIWAESSPEHGVTLLVQLPLWET